MKVLMMVETCFGSVLKIRHKWCKGDELKLEMRVEKVCTNEVKRNEDEQQMESQL